jgi:hypothetical protein
VCAHGAIVDAKALVCARQRPLQFPLHPYSERKGLQARGLTRIFMGEFSGERKRVHGMPALGG